ncbi:MAG: hypothetical protein P8183_02180 [Anaerolineae bacterium]
MSQMKKQIANLLLKSHKPTRLKFEDLHTWTIWRFPRKVENGYCGAVHPPIAAHGWLPAVICVTEKFKETHIYGHLDQTFETPEAAANYLENKAAKQ